MIHIFLKQCSQFLGKAFETLFTEEKTETKKLHAIPLEVWRKIVRPMRQETGVIFFFSYEHKVARQAILRIKNNKDIPLTKIFTTIVSDFLLEELSDKELFSEFKEPLIVAIPTNKKRDLKKGFNPSELLAEYIANSIPHLTFVPRALIKIKETRPQKELTRNERLVNVKRSMSVNKKIRKQFEHRCVIVVDDIVTTGATLAEAKRALLISGAKKVLCVALAH